MCKYGRPLSLNPPLLLSAFVHMRLDPSPPSVRTFFMDDPYWVYIDLCLLLCAQAAFAGFISPLYDNSDFITEVCTIYRCSSV